ncbi:hypothetical protein [Nocardia sp. XZ_19_385]|uniref:hypothetical protein n=1 Tax=Nocardia sp. XZ_19_385 TaxID=2769488 RepID=UPI00188F5B11|nr:hypothetical protein [Nocardia sp. XZ_19_385]
MPETDTEGAATMAKYTAQTSTDQTIRQVPKRRDHRNEGLRRGQVLRTQVNRPLRIPGR